MILGLHKWLDFIAYWWHQLTTSRYVLHLERENKRLLGENAALHATVHGLHGVPGRAHTPVAAAHVPDVPMAVRESNMATAPTSADGPKVVRSSSLRRQQQQEKERELWQKHQERERNKLQALQNALNDEIKAEIEKKKGTGYVVTASGAEPVKVNEPEEPILLDEPEVKVEEA